MVEQDIGEKEDLKRGLEVKYKAWIYQGRIAMFPTKLLSQPHLSVGQVLVISQVIDERVRIVSFILQSDR